MKYGQQLPNKEKYRYRRGHGRWGGYGLLLAAALLGLSLLTACGAARAGASPSGEDPAPESAGAEAAGQDGMDGQEAEAGPSAQNGEAGMGLLEDGNSARAETEEGTEDGTGTAQDDAQGTQEGAAAGGLEAYLTQDGYLDLEKLQEINTDIYAWLDIPGTGISFPILQSAVDETYYLSHNEAGEADDAGCIYTEYFNRKDFSDPNTVVYGRNVDGRFAQLHNYQDRDYFDSHRSLNIYLADRVLRYEIFAAYNYDDRHLIKIYDFWDKDIYTSYLETVFSQRAMDAYVDDAIEVTADDRIITLSTGVTGQDDRRYLVQAVQIQG